MRKFFCKLAVIGALFLVGCGGSLYVDQAFVGTWHFIDDVRWTYVFEADGSGQRGDLQLQEFTWGTRDGLLVLDHGPRFIDDEYTYSFDGNMLNLVGDIGNFYYFRFVPDQNLIGTWLYLDGWPAELTYLADGSGYYIPFLGEPDEREDFNWFTVGDLLIEHFNPLEQGMWTFSIIGDVLVLESRQVTGQTDEFTRGSLSQDSALVGEWAWADNDEWEYFFVADGRGERGYFGDEWPFDWTTFGDQLFIFCHVKNFMEHWRFTISGNMLHLVSMQVPDFEFSYVRVN